MIYFIQAGLGGPIKIGMAGDIAVRLETLQIAHHEVLTLLGVMPGYRPTEREVHRRFAVDHIRGEWYAPSNALLVFIAEMRLKHGLDMAKAPPSSRGPHWTPREEMELRRLVELKWPRADIANFIGRSERATRTKISRLAAAKRRGRRWSPKEIALLRTYSPPKRGVRWLAERIGRGEGAVEKKLSRLGIVAQPHRKAGE